MRDEYQKIPSEIAKQAYTYVAALGQFDLVIRYETIMHILKIGYENLGKDVFEPARGVLLSGEESGSSRHSAGFRLRARHPIIASIIFAAVAPDDDDKLEIINRLLSHIDPGFDEDKRLLDQMIRKRQLVDTLADPAKRRSIYDRFEAILPGDAFVLQQRSMLERDLNSSEAAVDYARRAVRLRPDSLSIQNTLGLALEHLGREVQDPLRRQSLLKEANRIFDQGIRTNPTNAYSYQGKYYIMRQYVDRELDPEKNARLRGGAISLLREAYESTNEDSIIAGHLAREESALGTREEAIRILERALDADASDTRLRDLLIQYQVLEGNLEFAATLARDGVVHDPTSWRLQRHIARITRQVNGSIEAIKGHYEAAIRHRRGDVNLMVEFGAFLFQAGRVNDSIAVFNEARELPITSDERKYIRGRWKAEDDRDKVFIGTIIRIQGGTAYVRAVPDNFEVMFWKSHERFVNLRVGARVRFTVRFNAYGPLADILS